MADLKQLVELSNRYGSNPDLVLAGGGNTSYKENGILYVKCSGTSLSTIDDSGFVAMDIGKMHELMDKEYPSSDSEREALYLKDVMDARCDEDMNKRPSVEALLHSLFPQSFVLHIHPALVNGVTCAVNGEKLVREILGDKIIWIDICRPGYTLAKLCYKAMCDYYNQYGTSAKVILLQNHGIFFAGDTPEEIGELVEDTMEKLNKCLKRRSEESESLISAITGKKVKYLPIREAAWFVENEDNAMVLSKPFTPDHIVYCGPFMYFVRKNTMYSDLTKFKNTHGDYPKVVLLEKTGIFAVVDDEHAIDNIALLVNDAMKIAFYANKFSNVLPMTDELTDFITHWEAEAYRKKQA